MLNLFCSSISSAIHNMHSSAHVMVVKGWRIGRKDHIWAFSIKPNLFPPMSQLADFLTSQHKDGFTTHVDNSQPNNNINSFFISAGGAT